MNWVPSRVLPVPDGPATSTLSPSGMPPPSIASSSATPNERRPRPLARSTLPSRPNVRGNVWSPESLIRNVCRPGTEPCPRSFTTCNFRTIEFCSTCCESQKSPSATVKTGLSRISSITYSPIRNVVACQLVRCRASCWMNAWSSSWGASALARRATVRNESTMTNAGLVASTSLTIAPRTAPRSPSSTNLLRLMKRTEVFSLSWSKKLYCC